MAKIELILSAKCCSYPWCTPQEICKILWLSMVNICQVSAVFLLPWSLGTRLAQRGGAPWIHGSKVVQIHVNPPMHRLFNLCKYQKLHFIKKKNIQLCIFFPRISSSYTPKRCFQRVSSSQRFIDKRKLAHFDIWTAKLFLYMVYTSYSCIQERFWFMTKTLK